MTTNPGVPSAGDHSTAQGGADSWLTTELTADTYLLAVYKPPADEPEARPVVTLCQSDSDLVDALFMKSTCMTALFLLYVKPDGTNLLPRLLPVIDVVRCQVPERGNRLVTRLTTSCGLQMWLPGAGTIETLEASYLVCHFQASDPN